MLLDSLKDFQWYNEPENVRFTDDGMLVTVEEKTDFWQAIQYKFHRDNGHFFYTSKMGDFSVVAKLKTLEAYAFDQCGLMVRLDNLNWAKIGLMSETKMLHSLGCVVTARGCSDLSQHSLTEDISPIWFKLSKKGNNYMLSYSSDGIQYNKVRQFYLENASPEVKVGAYFASPQRSDFEAILEKIEFL